MPVYTTLCPDCGYKEAIYRKVAERDALDPCVCGGAVSRILEAPMIQAEITPYLSPNGTPVHSRAQRREDLKRSNAYEWEPGIDKDIARKKADNIAASFKPISDAVDHIVRDMAVSGKLENVYA